MILAMLAAASLSMGSTSYCLHGQMADGTYTRAGSAAMNGVPLGTHIDLVGRRTFFGRRHFVVRDRIGWGTRLDLWSNSCSASRLWGRKTVRIRLRRP